MAFLDFMNQGIGGMQQAQGPNVTGEAGVGTSQPIGPTYNDMAKAAMMYGSKPGSSAPRIAQGMPSSANMYGQQTLTPLSPNAPPQQKKAAGQGGEGSSDDSLAAIGKFIMGLFGGV